MVFAFWVFFLGLTAPSIGVIGWLALSWFWYAFGAIAKNPGDGDLWFTAMVLPGAPLVLGVSAVSVLAWVAYSYFRRGRSGLQQKSGALVTALLLAMVPLAFTLPLALLVLSRNEGAEPVFFAIFGSGVFPLVSTVWLLVWAIRADRAVAVARPSHPAG
ncbi:MAG: hypothetical protein AAGB11_07595 [Pseudomonadota bacterium]